MTSTFFNIARSERWERDGKFATTGSSGQSFNSCDDISRRSDAGRLGNYSALGSGLITSGPESDGCEGDGGQKIAGEFVETRRDASEVLQLVKEALDEIAATIEALVDASLNLAVTLRGNVGVGPAASREFEQGLGVISSVGDQIAGSVQARDQRDGRFLVGRLTGGQHEADRQTLAIDDDIDLGAQSSTRTADGVIRTPFFPPAACWWARMIELSISAMDCGDRSAKASKIRSQTPAFAHRLYRL